MKEALLDPICLALTRALEEIVLFQRRFHPPEIEKLKNDIQPLAAVLKEEKQRLVTASLPEKWEKAVKIFEGITDQVLFVLNAIMTAPAANFQQTVVQVMRSLRKTCQAQEYLYPLRTISPYLRQFFLEPSVRDRIEKLDPKPQEGLFTGLIHFGMKQDDYERGTMSLYIPESYTGDTPWPLVVALHGGYGHGRDFIWTWLKEAKSRQFILMAPTSMDTTWSILEPANDGKALMSMLEFVKSKWAVDMDRVLVTGISDGGTFSLVLGIQEGLPFTAFASVAGVLPPFDLSHAKGKRIYMVHGALDWMFPPQLARMAFDRLKAAGSDVTFKLVEDLSHTYPREENSSILQWFDPDLDRPSEEK